MAGARSTRQEKIAKDYCAIARQYCADVAATIAPACQWVQLACQRQTNDLERWATEGPYRFDEAAANRVCWFIEQLRHVKSSVATKAGEKIQLLPYQIFILTTIFGWLWRETGKRRFRRAWVEMGRGNGKSTLSSGVALYTAFCCGDGGADVCTAASMLAQARIVLDDARDMVKADKSLAQRLGLEVTAHTIKQESSNSEIHGLSQKASSAEGLSISTAILDEVHTQRGRQLHDVLSTGTTKRQNSLFLLVTTAGDDVAGIGFEIRTFLQNVLLGDANDESYFGIMFTVDATDDWRSPDTWRKANPSWGISVDPNAISEECNRAKQLPGLAISFRTHHLCEWLQNGSVDAFLPQDLVRDCYDKNLNEEDFVGQPCTGGLDLARRLDLCSYVRVHSKRGADGRIHHYVFNKNWIPEATARSSTVAAYQTFVARGELICTPGTTTNLEYVEDFILGEVARHPDRKYRDLGFDPMESGLLVTHLRKRTGREDFLVECPQSAKYLTAGCIELQDAVASGRLHTNSALLLWCLGNLHCKNFSSNLIQPVRQEDRTQKTDAATALIIALRSVALLPLEETKVAIDPFKRKAIYNLFGDTPQQPKPAQSAVVKEGQLVVRMKGTGEVKSLPQASARFLVEMSAAEYVNG
jgi:phage terminase large subunit-like protein